MKKVLYIIPLLFLTLLGQVSCSKEDDEITPSEGNGQTIALTEEEKADLIYMREEEKLARDVYVHSYDVYGMQIFKNISSSEQTHMDQLLALLQKYTIEDPASQDIGVFNNSSLQKLYDDLIDRSNKSLLEALLVGATIEDLDIYDLKEAITKTEKSDIKATYELLWCGSRNHARSYDAQVKSNGGSYDAQYITAAEYQGIIDSPHEKCGQ